MTVYMPAVVIMSVHVDTPDAMRMVVMETARIGYYYDGEYLWIGRGRRCLGRRSGNCRIIIWTGRWSKVGIRHFALCQRLIGRRGSDGSVEGDLPVLKRRRLGLVRRTTIGGSW